MTIAIYSDNRRYVANTASDAGKRNHISITMLFIGILLVMTSVGFRLYRKSDHELANPLSWMGIETQMTYMALVACIGFLMIFVSIHWLYERRGRGYALLNAGRIISVLVFLVLICIFTYLLMYPFVRAGFATYLEIAGTFGSQMNLSALVVSFLFMFLACQHS